MRYELRKQILTQPFGVSVVDTQLRCEVFFSTSFDMSERMCRDLNSGATSIAEKLRPVERTMTRLNNGTVKFTPIPTEPRFP